LTGTAIDRSPISSSWSTIANPASRTLAIVRANCSFDTIVRFVCGASLMRRR
jgi:hypothetical protein